MEANGYAVIEDFLKPDEIEQLLEAGKKLCLEAPQEDRKVFSGVNSDKAQSREKYFIESGDKVRYFFEEGAIDEKGELKLDPLNALNKVSIPLTIYQFLLIGFKLNKLGFNIHFLCRLDMRYILISLFSKILRAVIVFVKYAGNWATNDLLFHKACTFTKMRELEAK